MTSFDRPVVPEVGIITAIVVLVDRRRPATVGFRVVQGGDVDDRDAGRRERRRELGVGDDECRRDLRDEARELLGAALGIERHLDRADLHEREPRQQIVGRVARRDDHAVADGDSHPAERARGAVDPRLPRRRTCTRHRR